MSDVVARGRTLEAFVADLRRQLEADEIDELIAALRSDSRETTASASWLIEGRGETEDRSGLQPNYWTGAGWTFDPNEAARYATQEIAEVVRQGQGFYARVVEHVFLRRSDSPEWAQHLQDTYDEGKAAALEGAVPVEGFVEIVDDDPNSPRRGIARVSFLKGAKIDLGPHWLLPRTAEIDDANAG